MKKIIQLFKQQPFKISNTEWYLLTQTNFEIHGRKLYNKRKNSIELNPYFLYDKLKSIKDFNIFYISAFSDVEDFAVIDYDFQTGFNNFGILYEKEFISTFTIDQNDVYLIVRPTVYTKDFSDLSMLFNDRSEEYIEFKYNVVYKNLDKIPTFIVKLENINQLTLLNEYIYGYLINTIENKQITLNKTTSFYELEVLNNLMDIYELVILRTPLFDNYNLTIYTRCEDTLKVRNKLISYVEKMKIELQEKIDINNNKNLLKYW